MSNGLPEAGLPTPEALRVPDTSVPSPDQLDASQQAETGAEMRVERIAESAAKKPTATHKQVSPVVPAVHTATPTATKDEVTMEVEKILEDGLGPFYASLPEHARPLFRQKGEQAATEISSMVRSLHVQVKRVLELIYIWLKTIPGVNKFFLEQEAKIKTDRIVQLVEERKKDLG